MCDTDKYKGMTVNERLYVSGFMNEFERAVKNRNVAKIRKILKNIYLTETSNKLILKSYGLDFKEKQKNDKIQQ